MSRPNNRVNNTKIDQLAERAKSEVAKEVAKVKESGDKLAREAAQEARALAKTTGEKLKAAGIKLVDLSK